MLLEKIFITLGEKAINFFTSVYELTVMFLKSIRAVTDIWFYRRQIIEQLYSFSIKTLPIASIIAIFVGFGSTVQGVYQSSGLIPRYFTINVIFKSTIIELSPIILSLVLAGKIGASVAAEIGSMRISEQIDALETTPLDPIGFLVMPRILAALIMMPVIVTFANALAMFAAFIMSTMISEWVNANEFFNGMKMDFKAFELLFGSVIKPAVFGVFIALVGCYFGMKTSGGARGVGKSSTSAVVLSAVMVVILDYYLGELLL
ncbi:MAG: ABC transporter permease [Calditrichia bacterium]